SVFAHEPAVSPGESPPTTSPAAHPLDWVPLDELSEQQLEAMPTGCCGTYVPPVRTDQDANADPATASIRAKADSSETQQQTTVIMQGNVELTQGYRSLSADQATFNQQTQQADISGQVELREPGLLLRADTATMSMDRGDASLEDRKSVV